MSEYEASRTLHALPELVFNEASDLRSMDRWLPHEVHVEPQEPPAATVTVQHGAEEIKERALANTEQDQLRIEWGTRDDGRYSGWLQVAGTDSGTSEVTVHLSFFDPAYEPPRPQVEAALDRSLELLAEQVRLRSDTPL